MVQGLLELCLGSFQKKSCKMNLKILDHVLEGFWMMVFDDLGVFGGGV